MPDTSRLIMLIQIPIIISIIIVSINVRRYLEIQKNSYSKNFFFIILGWIVNLIYISLKYYSKKSFLGMENEILSSLFDLASSYFFLIGAFGTVIFRKYKKSKKITLSFLFIAYLAAGIINVLYSKQSFIFLYIQIKNLPIVFCDFLSLFSLAQFFKHFVKKVNDNEVKFLFYGTILYCLIQFLNLLDADNLKFIPVEPVGFLLGALSKFCILIGLSILMIEITKELSKIEMKLVANKNFSNRLDLILGRTFHEIIPPLVDMEMIITSLISNEDNTNEFRLGKKAKKEIEKMENAVIRARTIIDASIELYESDSNLEFFEKNDLTISSNALSEVKNFNNINTILEIALMNFKNKVLKDQTNNNVDRHVKIYRSYGGNCNIFCNSTQMVQVFFNLFKNSYEAVEKENSFCNIYISTKNAVEIDPDQKRVKKVHVEIEDDGPGIPKEIQSKVFESGFSTKEKLSKIKGFGLEVVKFYTELNNGSVDIESPVVTRVSHQQKNGTKFIFNFEKS